MTFPVQMAAPPAAASAKAVALADIPVSWDAAWTDLAASASEPNPFAECWFMRPAIRELNPSPDSRMIGVWRDGALIGMIPLILAKRYGRMPIRHVENWVHYHCFYGVPLVRKGAEGSFWEAVLDWLDGSDWAKGFLHVVGLDPGGPVFSGLKTIRRCDVVHRTSRAMLHSNLSPTVYYEANVRPKKRKEIRRLRSRLDEIGTVEFSQLPSDGPAEAWIADFLALEASGWKGREGSALGDSPSTRRFFEQAVAVPIARANWTCCG